MIETVQHILFTTQKLAKSTYIEFVKFVSNLERKSESELEHVQTKKNDVSVHKPVQTEECFDIDDLLFKQKDDERAKGSKDKKEAEIVQGRSECMSLQLNEGTLQGREDLLFIWQITKPTLIMMMIK